MKYSQPRARLYWIEQEPFSVDVDELYAVHALCMFLMVYCR